MNILKLFLILTIFLLSKTAIAADTKIPSIIITKITSDFIDIKRSSEIVDLKGNVTVERQDASMISDSAQIHYDESKKGQDEAIKRIDTKGNVKFFNGEFTATGNSGLYSAKNGKFIIEEDVIFNDGSSVSRGEKFIYDLKTQKGNLVGAKTTPTKDGRVIVIIGDDAKESKK
ncbi:MAG: lipopolysaccharide export system protein LptA [Rickettsiales bacterium]|jgi:lipopolysaccharide export system protein LptA